MHWVLQSGYEHERGVGDLITFLERASIPHSLHKVIPFIGEIDPDVNPTGPVMVYGTYGMWRLAKKKGWTPGSFNLVNLTYAQHVERWGKNMLNSDAVFCTFTKALDQVQQRGVCFIRPTVDSKFFAGMITDPEEFGVWHKKVVDLGEDDGSGLRGSTEVMISEPKNIHSEYRVWVVDGVAVTASLYKRGGRPLFNPYVEADVFTFATQRAQEWAPARAYVMDIGRTGNGLFIIETNTINSAGLYCADVCKLVMAIEDMRF